MLAALATTLAPIFSSAAGGSNPPAATPDTVTIDTGDITPTVGGGSMSLAGGGGMPWLAIVGGLGLLLIWRRP
jgi:hypothetical protein